MPAHPRNITTPSVTLEEREVAMALKNISSRAPEVPPIEALRTSKRNHVIINMPRAEKPYTIICAPKG